ncbi:MAG TPA: heme-binding protein [Steroidobacteraceae bacterium]|jgi:glc operon protein GlcG
MRIQYAVNLAEAQAAAQAAVAHAQSQGWKMAVAVADEGGALIALARMDDSSPASVMMAIEKARTAAVTGFATKLLEDAIKVNPAIISSGLVAVEGGLPITTEGRRAGGIGVSGGQSHEDGQVASVAIAKLVEQPGWKTK